MNCNVMNALQLSYQPVDGVLVYLGTEPEDRDKTFLQDIPQDDQWLIIDLDASDISETLKSKLKIIQCETIRSRRTDLYRLEADGLFFGAEADGDSKDAWIAKREEIKARYPWPGTYR